MASGRTQLRGSPKLNSPAIRESSQGVGKRQFFQLPILSLNQAIQLDNSPAYSNSRQQLAGMKRFGEIVVSAGRQPLYHLFFIRIARDQDEVGIALRKIAADALA